MPESAAPRSCTRHRQRGRSHHARLHLYHRPVICILLLEREGKTMNDQASPATSPADGNAPAVDLPISWKAFHRPNRDQSKIWENALTSNCRAHSALHHRDVQRTSYPLQDGDTPVVQVGEAKNIYITYVCSNCRSRQKLYSLNVKLADDEESGVAYKFGELPPFGPVTRTRLLDSAR